MIPKATSKEITRWVRNKDERLWRRILLLLEESEKMSLTEIADDVDSNRMSVYRVLHKLKISRQVNNEKEVSKGRYGKKDFWMITEIGSNLVVYQQKIGKMPKRSWGESR